MQKRWILILGMHRSGTSALSGLLAQCGIEFGKSLLEGNEYNAKGYWEHQELNVINESIFQELGNSWNNPFNIQEKLNSGWEPSASIKQRMEALLLSSELAEAPISGLKDPRFSLFLPLWLPIFQKLNHAIDCLIPYRHPQEVAESLFRRNNMHFLHTEWLWNTYNLAAEASSRNINRAWISHKQLLENPNLVIKEINDHFALSLDMQHTSFIEKNLQHHKCDELHSDLAFTSKLFLTIQNSSNNLKDWDILQDEYAELLKHHLPYLCIISENWLKQDNQQLLINQQNQQISSNNLRCGELEQHFNNLNNHISNLEKHTQGLEKHAHGLENYREGLEKHTQGLEAHVQQLINELVRKDQVLNSLIEHMKMKDQALDSLNQQLLSLHIRRVVLGNLRLIKRKILALLPKRNRQPIN